MSEMISIIPAWFIPVLIILVSIIALTIILERLWAFRAFTAKISREEESHFENMLQNENKNDAIGFCQIHRNPHFLVMGSILENAVDITEDIENEKKNVLSAMEKYLPALGTIATVAPLLGLLGTVTGMIKSFRAFESTMNSAMMTGIDEALITTALGLIVAIPALIMYNYFVGKVNLLSEEMESRVNYYLRFIRKSHEK